MIRFTRVQWYQSWIMDRKYGQLGNTHVMKSCKTKQQELFLGCIDLYQQRVYKVI